MASPLRVSSASIGVTPIQCFCWTCAPALSESAYWLDSSFHQVSSNFPRSLLARSFAHLASAVFFLALAMSAKS